MFYQLPPVGNPVDLSVADQPDSIYDSLFLPYQVLYFASGTAALAAAITAAVRSRKVGRPEVILPAYSCPDLVSAVVFAGARPVLVDLEADRTWMDLQQLSEKISTETVAIIAVDLFGISERLEEIRLLIEHSGIVLIEDSAQFFPGVNESGADEPAVWKGDMVVLSFGRGKPVSLLGGGAVLSRSRVFEKLLPRPVENTATRTGQRWQFLMKANLYNLMILPRLYWIPSNAPFLHLGETRYHPLNEIGVMDKVRLEYLAQNISRYREYDAVSSKLSRAISSTASNNSDIVDLPDTSGTHGTKRLLRYPLLLAPAKRDRVFQLLEKAGLGPSLMYPTVLTKIPGLDGMFEQDESFPNAENFASRLLTLPLHNRVRDTDMQKIKSILAAA